MEAEGAGNTSAGSCTVGSRGDDDANGGSLSSRLESVGMAVGGPTPHTVEVGAAMIGAGCRWRLRTVYAPLHLAPSRPVAFLRFRPFEGGGPGIP